MDRKLFDRHYWPQEEQADSATGVPMTTISKVLSNKTATDRTITPLIVSKEKHVNVTRASKIRKLESDAHVRRPWTPSAFLCKVYLVTGGSQ